MQFKTMFSMALVSALAFGSCTAFAADSGKALTPQQQRMKDCNAEAKTKALAGDARKTFMSTCLKGETAAAPAAKTTQQEKMKVCNTEASGKKLKGDDRKTFMSTCLKGDGAAAPAH
ncbi:PsiF family protein [Dokdonella sp.]|uniref:PsiF family protein n=1 Tax=Dokdonella sp. TaxID=2291710 RepID=UPI0031F2D775